MSGISGLTQTHLHTDHTALEPAAATNLLQTAPTAYFNAGPTSTYYASNLATDKPTFPVLPGDASTTKPYVTSGYTPQQLRGAYGLNGITQTGKGVKVGIALFYDGTNVASDLATFSKAFGLPAPDYTDLNPSSSVEDLPVVGNIPVLDPLDAASEQTLDAEAIHQMAPDASIYYSGAVAPEDPTIYAALDLLIANGVAVINNSYGGVGDTDALNAQEFATLVTDPAKTMGVGLDYSTGDAADEVASQGTREVDFPASSDSVTGVGGTLLEVGKNDDYEGEAYWGTYTAPLSSDGKSWGQVLSQGAGAGGGVSTAYAEPSYQQGVVPAEETQNTDTATTQPGRVLPDVSMLADSTTGILVGETQVSDDSFPLPATPTYSTFRIGGTSVSSPLVTGLIADVDQAIGKSVGFANPTMYAFSKTHPTAFRDPTIGRAPGTSRLGGTAADVLAGPVDDGSGNVIGYAGQGRAVAPVTAEVRADFTDTANDGTGVGTFTDPTDTGLLSTQTGYTAGGNTVVFHLRAQGVLGTLEDLPGYDDSTGLGSPYAPAFVAAFGGNPAVASPPASSTTGTTPGAAPVAGSTTTAASRAGSLAVTGANPWLPVLAVVVAGAGAGVLALRRRLR